MSQKGIIINTTSLGHVDASDHAALFSAIFGSGGIMQFENNLEITRISDNKIKVDSGIYMMSCGIPIRVENYDELTVSSGTLGQKRRDLVIAEYQKNGNGTGDDIARIRILQGAFSSSNPKTPALTNTATVHQEKIATLLIDETTLSVESIDANILLNLSNAVFYEE